MMRLIIAAACAVVLANLGLPILYGGCATNRTSSEEKGPQDPAGSQELSRLRAEMVRVQLEGRDIRDARVLDAMLRVPRHEFVPEAPPRSAYGDTPLALALGQTISQPYIVAFMTQALGLEGDEKILEIGTGSGYQAAVLAEIVREVYTIEILPELQERALSVLGRLGYRNIRGRVGDGYLGWPEEAPFDGIIVTAAPREVPRPLLDQLKTGGRLVIPVGDLVQDLVVFEKGPGGISHRTLIPVRFVPMTGRAAGEK
jgi:protein-L-isoaspartate(D-aspartate) O-methyltransferase